MKCSTDKKQLKTVLLVILYKCAPLPFFTFTIHHSFLSSESLLNCQMTACHPDDSEILFQSKTSLPKVYNYNQTQATFGHLTGNQFWVWLCHLSQVEDCDKPKASC